MPQTTLEQRPIGRTDLTTSVIGLGCVTFGREIDEEQSFGILDYAVENGITFLDTAEAYGGGNSQVGRKATYGVDDQREVSTEMASSEKIIGRWLKKRGNRGPLVICSKVSSGASPDNIRKQVDASLEHLGVDCIDVYKIHSPDDQVPIAESLDALNEQINAGKIKVIGGSNYNAAQLRESLDTSASKGYARFEITQPPYSLADRSFESEELPLCAREQVAVTSYSPLAAGFMSGKYTFTEDRHSFPKGTRFDISPGHADIYFNDHNFRMLDLLRAKADELGVPMVRLAMAWVMANPAVTAVLVGARKFEHIDNALLACDMKIEQGLRDEMSAWD